MKNPLLIAILVCVTIISNAQVPTLVKDINATPGNYIEPNIGNAIYFRSGDYVMFPDKPIEFQLPVHWWVTDGTVEGTHIVDGADEYGQAFGLEAVDYNGSFFYYTQMPDHMRIVKYSPATNTFQIIKDLEPGFFSVQAVRAGDQLIFASSNESKTEFWSSDGTAAGTVKFATVDGVFDSIKKRASDGPISYFIANMLDQSEALWRTDGTQAGTFLLKGGSPYLMRFTDLYVINSTAYFFFEDFSIDSHQLWKSNGTSAGTEKIFEPNGQYNQLSVSSMREYNGKLIFSALYLLYITDGTTEGTELLAEKPSRWGIIYNDLYYYINYNFLNSSFYLAKTDGTPEGTSTIVSLGSAYTVAGPGSFQLGNKLLLSMDFDGLGGELGISDGTEEGTVLLKDINEGPGSSRVNKILPLNDKAIFLADDGIHGYEMWVTDGTSAGTKLLRDINSATGDGIRFSDMAKGAFPNQILFTAQKESNGLGLWITDGTAANTKEVYKGIQIPSYLGNLNSTPYFARDNGIQTVNANAESETIYEQAEFFYPSILSNDKLDIDGKLFFSAYTADLGDELWVTDGTDEGTHVVKDIQPEEGRGLTRGYAILFSDKLIFEGDDGVHGREPWISDGTEEGTELLLDLNPGAEGSDTYSPIAFREKIFFFVIKGSDREIWSTNGTAEGTQREVELSFEEETYTSQFQNIDGKLVFTVYKVGERSELWSSDGTQEGTHVVKSFPAPIVLDDVVSFITAVGDRAFFYATDDEYGRKLWTTDGTEGGTKVIDIVPGERAQLTRIYGEIHGLFYFLKAGEIWRSAGTLETTEKVADGNGVEFVVGIEEKIFLDQVTQQYGRELYTMPFEKIQQEVVFEEISAQPVDATNVDLNAFATSFLPVAFTASPSGRVTIDGNKINFNVPGKVTVTASQDGNNGVASAETAQDICVNPAAPAITVKSSSNTTVVLESSSATNNQWYNGDVLLEGATGKTYEATESGNYFVAVSIEGCDTKSTNGNVVDIVTGLEDEKNFSVYPNPAKDKLFIDWKGYSGRAAVIDVRGNSLINSSFVNKTELSTSQLSAGFYVLKITSGDKQIIRKFVKE